ncbi:MAG: BamA/TamA family outer membrane protein [Bacteroidota bacterium]
MLRLFAFGLLTALAVGCATTTPYIATNVEHSCARPLPTDQPKAYQVFLLGNTGLASADALRPTLEAVKRQAAAAGEESAVVLMGNSIRARDYIPEVETSEVSSSASLELLLRYADEMDSRFVFVPGYQEWERGRRTGAMEVKRFERYLEARLDSTDVVQPSNGFPGPAEVKLNDWIRLIALDTQWWLQKDGQPYGDTGEYDLETDGDFLQELDDLIKKRDDERLVVVGGHPMFSNGRHAGRVTWGQHLFPLRSLHPALVVPLPVIGSLGPLYNQSFGYNRQHLGHVRYDRLRTALTELLGQHPDLVYAAGHESNLQYHLNLHDGEQQHYLVSGSAGQAEAALRGYGAQFSATQQGFMTLHYFDNGSTWLEAWSTADHGTSTANYGTCLLRTELATALRERVDAEIPNEDVIDPPSYRDSTVVRAINASYDRGALGRFLQGDDYRDAWIAEVEMPILDLENAYGGLTPIKKGGGQQTLSLRLANPEGREFVVRSIDKKPFVPSEIRGTFVHDFIQDLTIAMQPFGAYSIPVLADAAGVYHTNPQMVVMPDDPRLGIYREQYANQVMLFEERPAGDLSNMPSFGRTDDAEGSPKLFRELEDDNDNYVDQEAWVRSRLFDMWLGDWDRHADQWRWAEFDTEDDNGHVYRPIPRDRDWAFFRYDGFLPGFIRYVMPQFNSYGPKYGNLKGLTQSGLSLDRRFASELIRADWIRLAEQMQARLTNQVFREAVAVWPPEIQSLYGEEFIDIMQTRRAKLVRVAKTVYDMQARIVDVVGSDKHERFLVTHYADSMQVQVWKTTKEGVDREVIYERMFYPGETDEVRLYGLRGNDRFEVSGTARPIRVRAIGGAGPDEFVDIDEADAPKRRRSFFYDTPDQDNTWNVPSAGEVTRSDIPWVNAYDPADFKYNGLHPVIFIQANDDDGLFLGGGVRSVKHGFRKEPFARQHTLKANIASRTFGYNVIYQGTYVDLFRDWNGHVDLAWRSPDLVRNFFGLGNETARTADRDFYNASFTQADVAFGVERQVSETVMFGVRPALQYVDVEETGVLALPQPGISASTFDEQLYAQLGAFVTMENTDDPLNPRQGVRWTLTADANSDLLQNGESFGTVASDVSLYLSPSLSPQITLALRAGGRHIAGDFPFYMASTLGSAQNLRGFRTTRFAGRSSLYQNAELRMKLFNANVYILRGEVGLLGFADQGRVWTDGESSSVWHRGYGGGAWFSAFGYFVVSTSVGFSEDETSARFQIGFLY